ncbi:MAG TPA: hypothetical protein VJ691_11015 [Vicinamibacterales bacterium]|nr:hypothetical protein [Vicinamibacterales bacterium]
MNEASRLLSTAAGTLAVGVLADSTAEHYRAAFHNRAMFVATAVSAAAAAAAVAPDRHREAARAVFAAAILTGIAGAGFHLFNVLRRTGGFSSTNVFRGAPVGAPIALTMAGVFGSAAMRVSSHDRRTGVLLGNVAAIGLAGTSIEAGILHFRGAFHNRLMYAPALIPPVAACSLAAATLTRSDRAHRMAESLLRTTSWLGIAGTMLHGWGVHRRMGGWRNWSQNLLAGPPLPAPPAFTGMALAGLAALALLRPIRRT